MNNTTLSQITNDGKGKSKEKHTIQCLKKAI